MEQELQTASRLIVLVGFQDQDNLGLRYLMSSVRQAGFEARIETFQRDPTRLVEVITDLQPLAVGFSLILQYMAPDFARVIAALRDRGVACHITMGGHYPSFDYAQVLQRMPGLDSIARFEGEATLVELLQKLSSGEDWRQIRGLACRDVKGVIAANCLRHAIADLDTLPWPDRQDIEYSSTDLPTASILGSRGCPWDCSFCSIRPFYEAQEGPLRRLRKPHCVVDEMRALHADHGVPVFLFQDDDFLAGGGRAKRWGCDIAGGLVAAGLSGKLVYKISCRSDEIDRATMEQLIAGGLTHVYMGVESGDPQALLNMSKRIKPEQHLAAGKTLKQLGLSFDFGFMLLDPFSTFQMVRNNISFLDAFVGDGWAVASFCRMLPYAGTPVKTKLEGQGRLGGTAFEPDYRFLDPRLDVFYDWMLRTFHERNFTNRGLCHLLKSLLFESRLRLPDRNTFTEVERQYAGYLTAVCNGLATYTLTAAVDYIENLPAAELSADDSFLAELTRQEQSEEQRLLREVVEFYWSVRNRTCAAPQAQQAGASLRPQGSFENSWTIQPEVAAN